MQELITIIFFLMGALISWMISNHLGKAKTRAILAEEQAKSSAEIASLKEKLANEEEKFAHLESLKLHLSDTFKSLSLDALNSNSQSFLDLASQTMLRIKESSESSLQIKHQAIEELVKPLQESLVKVDQSIDKIEKERLVAFASLDQNLKFLLESNASLNSQTQNLANALKKPHVRGRWGELQLRRVVEMAGMINYCDFFEQSSVGNDDKKLRPDLIVRLPGNKIVVIDSKAPLSCYLEALEAKNDQERKVAIEGHARLIKEHLIKLSQKGYWEQFSETPEFVVMFLPGENFFSAALEQDPELIEFGVNQRVILSTPTTLIALLRAVSYGWRQEQVEKNAQEISKLGRDLYDRMISMVDHLASIKGGLDRAVESYNATIGSFEGRVLPAARKFKELGATSTKEISQLQQVEKVPRLVSAGLTANSDS